MRGKSQALESLASYEKRNFVKLVSLNKKKTQPGVYLKEDKLEEKNNNNDQVINQWVEQYKEENNRKTSDVDYTPDNHVIEAPVKVTVKGHKIKEKYATKYLELKKVLSSYVDDEYKRNPLVPKDTKAFVVVSGGTRRRPRIVTSYPNHVFHTFNSDTRLTNRYHLKEFKRFRIKNQYLRNCLSYWPWWLEHKFEHNPYEQPFRKFPKGFKIKAVQLQDNYQMLVHRGFSDRRKPSPENEKTTDFSVAFTFLAKMDATLFLEQARVENRALLGEDKWWVRNKAIKHNDDIYNYSSVKESTLENFYRLLKKSQNKNKGRKVKKVGVVIPKFLYYKPVKVKTKRNVKRLKIKYRIKKALKLLRGQQPELVSRKFINFDRRARKNYYVKKRTFKRIRPKGLPDFPKEMLSESGFQGVPVYKTKPVEKNKFLSIPKRYKKYFTGKTLFITLDKNQYRKSSIKDNKNITFYKLKEEDRYIDNLKNVIEERKGLDNEVLENLLKNIDRKRWRGTELNSTLNFVKKNYNEPNLLEKTNYYIKKVKRRSIFRL